MSSPSVSSKPPLSPRDPFDPDRGLENALKRASKQALQYEYQMKDFESKLTENLSNFRAVESLLQESFSNLQRSSRRADRALHVHVPHINNELEKSAEDLMLLSESLPVVQTQVSDIRHVYDSGREKAQALVQDLTWLNTEWYERFRIIIFTPNAPVSWRWKAIMRVAFCVSFVMCMWLMWTALRGAVRAHRIRLVWGERLMS